MASLIALATLAKAAAFAVFSGCAGSPPALSVVRSHSAGMELVTSMGPDVEAPFHLEREWRLAGLTGELHVTDCTVPPGEVVQGRGYTDVIPAIRRLPMDSEGGAVADEPNRVDILDSSGAYLGTLTGDVPIPVTFPSATRLIGLESDEYGVRTVGSWRVVPDGGGD